VNRGPELARAQLDALRSAEDMSPLPDRAAPCLPGIAGQPAAIRRGITAVTARWGRIRELPITNPYLSIGVAPRLVLNVKPSDGADGADADKEIDLRARITGRLPVAPGVELYASVMPGYSIVTSSQDGVDSATGFALAGALGATYDLTPKIFLGAEVGYQRAFTSATESIAGQNLSADLELSYLHVGIGAGTRF
jgi:hypothetical protein